MMYYLVTLNLHKGRKNYNFAHNAVLKYALPKTNTLWLSLPQTQALSHMYNDINMIEKAVIWKDFMSLTIMFAVALLKG